MAQATKTIKPFARFWKLITNDKSALVNLYSFAFLAAIVSLSLPLGVQAIVNLITIGTVSTSFYVLVFLVVLGYGLNGYLQVLQISVAEVLQRKIFVRSSFDFAYRTPKFKLSELVDHHLPELMNRFFETLTIQKALPKILIDFAGSSIQVFISLILLSFYHPFFIIFGLLAVLLTYFIVSILVPYGLETALKESKKKYMVAHWLEELARSMEAFKLAGSTELPLLKADRVTSMYLEARESHFKILLNHYYSIILFKIVVAGAFLLIGGILVMERQMNIGQFVAAEIIVILLLNNVEKLISSLDSIYDILVGLEKLGNVTDIPLEEEEGLECSKGENQGMSLQIKKLSFYFTKESDYVLQDIDLTINSGDRFLVAGRSGSGKHTLIRLITGMFEDYQGTILINGISLNNLNLLKYRDKVTEVMGEWGIFEGTLMENICLGKNYDLEKLMDILRRAQLLDYIDNCPKGIYTPIRPEGKGLPGSIKIKLLFARVFAENPDLVILDESIYKLQKMERELLLEDILNPNRPWTVLMVSKHVKYADYFDKIAFMDKGKIVASTTVEDAKNQDWFTSLS
jgi:ABC-type bacteriocin/lantibiotic exporter with double-glycine peptidase domain